MSQGDTYASPEKTAIPLESYPATSCTNVQNGTGTCAEKWHKSDTACSLDVPADQTNENPGALAGATGANVQSVTNYSDHTPERREVARVHRLWPSRVIGKRAVDFYPDDEGEGLTLYVWSSEDRDAGCAFHCSTLAQAQAKLRELEGAA